MAQLREQQKATRRRDILIAASTLFRREGYEETRVEKIAELAKLSTGTIYNYFPTKGDLLLAVVLLDGDASLAEGAALIADPPDDALDAVDRLMRIYIDYALTHLDAKLWCSVMATALNQSRSEFGRGYFNLSQRLTDQLAELVTTLHRQGKLALTIDAALAGRLLFNTMDHLFMHYITSDEMDRASLDRGLHQQNEALLLGVAQPPA